VRDLVIGRRPAKDLDIFIFGWENDPKELVKVVKLGPATVTDPAGPAAYCRVANATVGHGMIRLHPTIILA